MEGENDLIWGSFSGMAVSTSKMNGAMGRFTSKGILWNIMLPFTKEKMPIKWKYQQDEDPNHSARYVKERFTTNKINVLN